MLQATYLLYEMPGFPVCIFMDVKEIIIGMAYGKKLLKNEGKQVFYEWENG